MYTNRKRLDPFEMEESDRAAVLDEALGWSPMGLQQTIPGPDIL